MQIQSGTAALLGAVTGLASRPPVIQLTEVRQEDGNHLYLAASVPFPQPFKAVPTLQLGVVSLDYILGTQAQILYKVSITEVTAQGFTVEVLVGAVRERSGVLYRVDLSWLAIAA